MLEKQITVVDLWKFTLYGLNHENLYNSTPIAMHKTTYREMSRMAFNGILGKNI